MSAVLAGLGLGLSLIVAIGAQNAFLLRQGLRREHVTPVVIICAASDVALYVVGAAGFGTIATRIPWLIDVVRWAGAAFLIGYGGLAARRALRPDGSALRPATDDDSGSAGGATSSTPNAGDASNAAERVAAGRGSPDRAEAPGPSGGHRPVAVARRGGMRTVVVTALAFTWLNPHVYLDTVFLAGSVAAAQGEGRWAFVLGASVASISWFTALGYGARALGRWLSRPRAWRVLDAAIAAVMVGIAISLLV